MDGRHLPDEVICPGVMDFAMVFRLRGQEALRRSPFRASESGTGLTQKGTFAGNISLEDR